MTIYSLDVLLSQSGTRVDVFLELPCFLHDPTNVGNLISGSCASLKPSLYIWKFSVHVRLKGFEHNLASIWNECNCMVVWTYFASSMGVSTHHFGWPSSQSHRPSLHLSLLVCSVYRAKASSSPSYQLFDVFNLEYVIHVLLRKSFYWDIIHMPYKSLI